MNVKLFTIPSEEKSALKLGYDTRCSIDHYIEDYDKNLVVIRWGNSSRVYSKDGSMKEFKNVINSADSIRFNCEKNKSLQKLSTVVKTPRLFQAGEMVPKGCKIVYRYNEHTAGRDFRIMTGPFKIEKGFYGKEFINTKKEWRVWFCGLNNICLAALRVEHRNGLDQICRSTWGYFFRRLPEQLHEQVIKGAKILNLEFGCADVLEFQDQYYFCEFNTASSVDADPIKKYFKKYLPILIKEKFPYIK